eukprot:Phypoly_transcript_12317.p1 GENE.Phypoly_transcript_12317~~Phypoly_transcript_12317.p1  ORF type:complete len:198 (+),score=32.44 Phypoly_transcript_12317:198-791(+)
MDDGAELLARIFSLKITDPQFRPRRKGGDFSVCEFKDREEDLLNIKHSYVSKIEELFPEFDYTHDFSEIFGFNDAMLDNIDHSHICNNRLCTSQEQRTLLQKLQAVFTYNYADPSLLALDETSIDDFVRFVFNLLKFDAYPIEIRSKPFLDLEVGNWLFAAIPNLAIRAGDSVFMSIVEKKHRKSSIFLPRKATISM